MSFYLKNHQAGNDTTLVTRGVAKCIRESKTEKDVIDMLERGQLERTSEILLKNNEIKSRGEWPALVTAAYHGYKDVMHQLIELGVADKDEVNEAGATSAKVAATAGHTFILEYLYELGADMEKADENGQTPLFVAVARHHLNAADFLLRTAQVNPNVGDIHGATPLYMASAEGNRPMVELLLGYGALQLQSIKSGATSFHVAVEGGHMPVSRLLLKCAPELINVTCSDGKTPLHKACSIGNLGMVTLILKCNKNAINAPTKMGVRPVHCAAKHGYEDVACELLYHGADPNAKTNNGVTPVMMALMNGHGATACIFKDAGSTIILPRTLRNFEFISLLIISFLFMWPGLLNKTQMYYLSILLVLIIGSVLGYYAHLWLLMKKYQAESVMMGDIATSNKDNSINADTTFNGSCKGLSSSNMSKASTVMLTPRESLRGFHTKCMSCDNWNDE
eukprot:488900_1